MASSEQSGHLAWCALVALALARQEGGAQSPAQENLFLTRWLSTALKQRRFPREVNSDIEWLVQQGRQLGLRARLTPKLDYLWRSSSGTLTEQCDLFRLTYALDVAKEMAWGYWLLTDQEWHGRDAATLNNNINGLYLRRTSLDSAFDDDGAQIAPLRVRLTGNATGIENILKQSDWLITPEHDDVQTSLYRLTAITGNQLS